MVAKRESLPIVFHSALSAKRCPASLRIEVAWIRTANKLISNPCIRYKNHVFPASRFFTIFQSTAQREIVLVT